MKLHVTQIPFLQLLFTLLLFGCQGPSSKATILLTVHYQSEWNLDQLRLSLPTRTSQVPVEKQIRILLADEMADAPLTLTVDGLAGADLMARGTTTFTAKVGQTTQASVILTRIPCGAWCSPGAKRCVGDGVAVCKQRDSNQCFEWSEPAPCGSQAPYCSNGECHPTCVDECTADQTQCDGPSGVRLCGENDSDSCWDWLPTTNCEDEKTCSNGSCSSDCEDACSIGTKMCSQGGTVVCEDRDENGCSEWGPVTPCNVDEICAEGVCQPNCANDCTDQVDILFVIDNSGSMREEQANLASSFRHLSWALLDENGQLPDLHLGVVSTDIGAGPYGIEECTGTGDNGRLLAAPAASEDCPVPQSEPYIIDSIAPDGSRIRNYDGDLGETFSCIAQLGTTGCGFEQPLESMYRALNGSNPQNHGFLRDHATLVVVFVTDEDDCSASDVYVFDTDAALDKPDSPLGYLSSFRCFEFGVKCTPDNPRELGAKQDCHPRTDSPYIHPVSRYITFLQGLKGDPKRVVVAGIMADAAPVSTTLNTLEQHALEPSCTSTSTAAAPAVRPILTTLCLGSCDSMNLVGFVVTQRLS